MIFQLLDEQKKLSMASNNHFTENNPPFAANRNSMLAQLHQNWARQQMHMDLLAFHPPQFGYNPLQQPMMNQMYPPMQFQQPFYPSPAAPFDPNMFKYYNNHPLLNQCPQPMKHTNTTIQIGVGNQFGQQQSPKIYHPSPMSPAKPVIKRIMQRPASSPKSPEIKETPELTANCENRPQGIDKVFCDLQRIALNGCEIAEKVVLNHQKRPCFKKIDLLCGRLKQDLTNNNNVVANINSQGVAWAVKDFIFVFTRIINAWIILRGYVYNQADGLDRIKGSIDPNLNSAFLEWQESTRKLTDSLVKSYVSLDHLVQNQRSPREHREQQEESPSSPIYDANFLNELNRKLFDPYTIENSEEAQRMHSENGTYFKSAIYMPLQKISPIETRSCDFALNGIFNDEFIESEMEKVIGSPTRSSLRSSTPQNPSLGATPKLSSFERNPFNTKLRLAERFDLFGFNDTHKSEPSFEFEKSSSISPAISPPLEIGSGDSVSKPLYSLGEMKDPTEPPTLAVQFEDLKMEDYSSEMAGKVRFLINKVLDLKEAAYFISPTMAKDYFPTLENLIPDDSTANLNVIIKNIQSGERDTIENVVFDLRAMIDASKTFVQGQGESQKEWLQTISCFESGLLKILLDDAFGRNGALKSEE